MDGRIAEKDQSRSVGKNWLMTGFWKARTGTESNGTGAAVTGSLVAHSHSSKPKLSWVKGGQSSNVGKETVIILYCYTALQQRDLLI